MPTEPTVTVYGAYYCPDCRRTKQFLGEQFIPYKWVDIEQDKAGEQYVLEKNHGKRIIPTVEFADGSLLVEPTNAEPQESLMGMSISAHLNLKALASLPSPIPHPKTQISILVLPIFSAYKSPKTL